MQPLTEESGPHSAYAALYDRYASLVLSYIYRFLSCQQDAEDILTEVFLAAFKNEKLTSLIPEQ
ncbi:MAG: hypothetical protein J2P37_17100, partial [Ktedonobacteraceae bacterium]|nr:hypothetical protein [Ktedonobacteraceae bacterium]